MTARRVTDSDLIAAINALSIHVLGDLCEPKDIGAIERVRDWLEAEQQNRVIKSVAREMGVSARTVRDRLKKTS